VVEERAPRYADRVSVVDSLVHWVQTPGFAGVAAVVAALIAFVAANRQGQITRAAHRKEQWWARAQWALDLTLSDRAENREIGLRTLLALAGSEWAAENEGDIIAAATAWALESPAAQAPDGAAAHGVLPAPRERKEPPTDRERSAAARARIAADRLRGVGTPQSITDIADAASGA
jgi:hypothetical protein